MARSQNKDFERRSTAELEMLLKEELAKEQKDVTLIHRLLEQLKAQSPTLLTVTQEEADQVQQRLRKFSEEPPAPKHPRTWQTRFAVAAAVLCLVFLAFPIASGAPFIQKLVAKWNEDFFWIEVPATSTVPQEDYTFQTDNPGLQQLYDAVAELGITAPVVPMWLPEGFELLSMEVHANEGETAICSLFRGKASDIVFFLERRDYNIERHKDFENPEMWKYMGIDHFYIKNNNGSKVIWVNGDCEIMISTSLDELEMRSIVSSIYYGKEGSI